MYHITEIVLIIICILGSIAGIKGHLKYKKYKQDIDGTNKIIDYFKANGKDGIKPLDIPKELLNTGYIYWMNKDKILIYKDGKYFLNK